MDARDGLFYKPQTGLAGIVEKQTGEGDFNAPQEQLDAITARSQARKKSPYLDPAAQGCPGELPVDGRHDGRQFRIADAERQGELVGLLFDGTYESVASDYLFDQVKTRSIHVDSRYMLWNMAEVDGAGHLLKEMRVAEAPARPAARPQEVGPVIPRLTAVVGEGHPVGRVVGAARRPSTRRFRPRSARPALAWTLLEALAGGSWTCDGHRKRFMLATVIPTVLAFLLPALADAQGRPQGGGSGGGGGRPPGGGAPPSAGARPPGGGAPPSAGAPSPGGGGHPGGPARPTGRATTAAGATTAATYGGYYGGYYGYPYWGFGWGWGWPYWGGGPGVTPIRTAATTIRLLKFGSR